MTDTCFRRVMLEGLWRGPTYDVPDDMQQTVKIAIVTAIGSIAGACGTTFSAYNGPELPMSELAVIDNQGWCLLCVQLTAHRPWVGA